jgi:DNA-binding beta-propeller fold protein YncE
MKMKGNVILGGIAVMLIGLLSTSAFAATQYKFEKIATIKLKGPAGHGDLLSFDPANNRIFVAMHDHGVCVVDTQTNKLIKYIPDVPAPNGSDIDGHYLYVAAGGGPGAKEVNAIIVIDTNTLQEVGRVNTKGTSPDWVAIDKKTHILYTGLDDNNWDEMYDISDPTKPVYKGKFDLYPPKPKHGPDVGTLVESKNVIYQVDDAYILKIDATTGKIEGRINTGVRLLKHGGTKASYFDSEHDRPYRRLWVATTNHPNPGVIVLTPDLGIIKTLPESGGVDDAEADPDFRLLYLFSSSSKGFDVYNLDSMTHMTHVSTGYGHTHTGIVDPKNHVVYAFGGDGPVLVAYKPVKE